MAISCRYISSHTRKLADKVFNGDVLTAWAVIPDLMNNKNITDETLITADDLQNFYNQQSQDQKTKYALEYPECELKIVPKGTEINFSIQKGDNGLYMEIPEGMSETEYVLKYLKEVGGPAGITSAAQIRLYESYYYKASELLQNKDNAQDLADEWFEKGKELFSLENKLDFTYTNSDLSINELQGPLVFVDSNNQISIYNIKEGEEDIALRRILEGATPEEQRVATEVLNYFQNNTELTVQELVNTIADSKDSLIEFLYHKGKVMQKYNLEDTANANNPDYKVLNEIRNTLYAVYKMTGKNYATSTFKDDGGLIKAENGFTYNKEQSYAIRDISQFIIDNIHKPNEDKPHCIRLVGAAGTGKTTIINEIIRRVNASTGYLKISVSATAHKATANLYSKIGADVFINNDVAYATIASLLGKGGELQLSKNGTLYTEFKKDGRERDLDSRDLIIIDEASMVSDEDYRDIIDEAPKDAVILFLGDNAQLPPIRKDEDPNAGRDAMPFLVELKENKLIERVRQGEGNPILDLADLFRASALDPNKKAPFVSNNDNNNNVIYTKAFNDDVLYRLFDTRRKSGNDNYVRIVTYTNASVANYNKKVHGLLYPEDALGNNYTFHIGEPVMFYDSYRLNDKESIENSEEVVITDISPIKEDTWYGIKYYEAIIRRANGKNHVIKILQDDPENWQVLKDAVAAIVTQRDAAFKAQDWDAYNDYKKKAAALQSKYGKAKLSYAITSHKSQGSTYTVSLVDEGNINSQRHNPSHPMSDQQYSQCMYTAITRASDMVIMASQSSKYFSSITNNITLPAVKKPNTQNSKNVKVYRGYQGNISSIEVINQPLENTVDARNFEGFSGDARGSDRFWRKEATNKGITNWKDYRTDDITNETPAKLEEIEKAYKQACEIMGKAYYPLQDASDEISKLPRRNYYQIENADGVFAVSRIIAPGQNYNNNKPNTTSLEHVDGGTGYAIEYGIVKNIPIHVFNTIDNKWYEWDYNNKKYIETDTPTLTNRFAGIGTRELTAEGEQAIKDVFNKTFGESASIAKPVVQKTTITSTNQPSFTSTQGPTISTDNIEDLYKTKKTGKMEQQYGNDKRPEVTATNTLDAIVNGERHATTRWASTDYWLKMQPGDIVKFRDAANRQILVRITKPSRVLPLTTDPEEWSRLEGWTVGKYNREVLPHVRKGEAVQIYFEYIPNSYKGPAINTTDINSIVIDNRIVNPDNVLNSPYFKREAFITREGAIRNPKSLYIFTDNTNRYSGNNPIDPNSKYAKKYGAGKTYANNTLAVLRGLDNAMPISTQRYYVPTSQGGDYKANRWFDKDVEAFADVLRDEIKTIIEEYKNGDYDNIIITSSNDGFFNSAIADISPTRCKKIYDKLLQGLDYLNAQVNIIGKAKAEARMAEVKQVLGNTNITQQAIQSSIVAGQQGISEAKYLQDIEPFFTREESAKIRSAIPNVKDKWGKYPGMLQVTSFSRHTDPVFFSKDIIEFLKINSLKAMDDPTRVNVVEIWTKHDGIPLQDILDACRQYRVAPMVSFSITTLGGTSFEEGVLKYQDLLDKIKLLVDNGSLNPNTTTIRLDPILYGHTDFNKVFDAAKQCIDMGFKKFVTSALQSYDYSRDTDLPRMVVEGINASLQKEGKTYDWDKYYGRETNKTTGKEYIRHTLKKEYADDIGNRFIEFFRQFPDVTIESCASQLGPLKGSACLDPAIIERLVDSNLDKGKEDDTRTFCHCYGAHSDFFSGMGKKGKECYSSCAYCYAGRSQDNKINYYNPDGTINEEGFIEVDGNTVSVKDLTTVRTSDDGINISTKSINALSQKLTNPGNNYTVNYKGTEFKNAEHAYQTWKSGEFDQKAYEEGLSDNPIISFKPQGTRKANFNTNYQTMVEIITEKFKQHPELMDAITIKGGSQFLDKCTHFVTGDSYWESGTGCQNKFIEALTQGYKNALKHFSNLSNKGTIISPTQVEGQMDKSDPINITIDSAQDNDIEIAQNSPLDVITMQLDPVRYSNRVKMIAHDVSTAITDKLDQLEEALLEKVNNGTDTYQDRELLSLLEDRDEDEDNTRAQLIDTVIDDVIKDVKQQYLDDYEFMKDATKEEIEEEYECSDGDYYREQYRIIAENFDYIFDDACQQIESKENVRIYRDENKVKDDITDETKRVDEQQDGDNDTSNRASGNDGWGAAVHDPSTSMRGVVKRALNNLKERNYDGSLVKDDLGDTVDVDPTKAVAVLLDELHKIVKDVTDFNIKTDLGNGKYHWEFPALKQIAKKYPWANTLYNNIYSDQNIKLASAIYSSLCLKFHEFSTQKDVIETIEEEYVDPTDGLTKKKYDTKKVRKVIVLNQQLSIEAIMNKLYAAYLSHTPLNDKSVWNSKGEYVLKNARELTSELETMFKNVSAGGKIANEIKQYSEILKSIGFETDPEELLNLFKEGEEQDVQTFQTLINNALTITRSVSSLKNGQHLIKTNKNNYQKIAEIIGTVTTTTTSTMFRQGGKSYSSYSYSNYLDMLEDGITSKNAKQYIEEEFLYDDFLASKNEDGSYKIYSSLIEDLYEDEEVRNHFHIKYVNEIDGKEYEKWSPDQIIKSNFTEYAAVPVTNAARQYGYYQMPIFSDSTMAGYVKLPKYIRNYQEEVNNRLVDVALQELSRIKKIKNRADNNASPIQRYDGQGDKFLFIPELNDFSIRVSDDEYVSLAEYCALSTTSMDEVRSVLKESIEDIMDVNFDVYITKCGSMISEHELGSKDYQKDEELMKQFYYNNTLAQTQIIQLLGTDLAYYKDYIDFQKRNKQCYASGSRLNTESEYGRKVQRTIYISDRIITSPSYIGMAQSINTAVAKGYLNAKEGIALLAKARQINATDAQAYRTLSSYRAILDMRGRWTKKMQSAFERFSQGKWNDDDFYMMWGALKPFLFANVKTHDGLGGYMRVPTQQKSSEFLLLGFLQGMYIKNQTTQSPVLMGLNRAMEDFQIDTALFESGVKAGGQGIIDISHSERKLNALVNDEKLWNTFYKKEAICQLILDDNYTMPFAEIREIAETIASAVDKNTISKLSEKNAALLKKVNKLSNWDVYKKGTDWELISHDIDQDTYNELMQDMAPSEDEVYEIIQNAIFGPSKYSDYFEMSDITGKMENKNVVHEIDYKYVMEAQPTVNHLLDAESIVGSQFRNIIVSDLPIGFSITIAGHTYTNYSKSNNEILKLYDSLLNENYLNDWSKVQDIFGSIEELQKKLMSIVKGNNSYGYDLLNALQLVEIPDGNGGTKKTFNIPPHNSVISSKIEQLILSVFKNNITKQYIRGGACVLVSSFGFENDLKIVRDSNGAITHFQCRLPAHTKELFKEFLKPVKNKKGEFVGNEIDINKIREAGLEGLLEGIGFRIPTEGKYSMANLMVVGFLPQQCGATIMIPADTTLLSGEDYDVDKKFTFFKKARRKTLYNMKEARKDFLDQHPDLADEIDTNYLEAFNIYLNEQTSEWSKKEIKNMTKKEYWDFRHEFHEWIKSNGIKKFDWSETAEKEFISWFNEQIKIKDDNGNPRYYKDSKLEIPTYDQTKDPFRNSKDARDNMVIDIANAILSHPDMSYIINKSGNYDTISLESDRMQIIKNSDLLDKWCDINSVDRNNLSELSKKILEAPDSLISDFIKKYKKSINPLDARTFAYFHEQNMVGKALVGIYANGTTLQSKYQHTAVGIDPKYTFTLNNYKVDSISNVRREDDNGSKLISTNASEFSAASVDNTKDPKLANINQSPKTAFITDAMVKMGINIQEISLFFSLPFFDTNINTILDEKNHSNALAMFVSNEPLSISSQDLVTLIVKNPEEPLTLEEALIDNKVRAVLAKIITVANRTNILTQISRADSPNGAISNTIAGAIQQVMKVDNFHQQELMDPVLTNTENIIRNITDSIPKDANKNNYRIAFDKSDMPLLQAAYTLGIENALNTVKPLFGFITDGAIGNLKLLDRECGSLDTIDTEIIQAYLREAVMYSMTDSPLFDNIDAQRQYYTSQYPLEFNNLKVLPKFKDYSIIKDLIVVQGNTASGAFNSKDSFNTIILPKSSKIKGMREIYARDLNMMLRSSDPEIRNTALNLFKYSYFIDGLDWRIDGFSLMFDTLFMTSVKSYIESLRGMTFDSRSNFSDSRFLEQFIYNHGSQIFKSFDLQQFVDKPVLITIPSSDGLYNMFKNPKTSKYYKYISIHGTVYTLDTTNSSDSIVVYNKSVSNSERFVIYNKNTPDVNTLHSDFMNMKNNQLSNSINTALSNRGAQIIINSSPILRAQQQQQIAKQDNITSTNKSLEMPVTIDPSELDEDFDLEELEKDGITTSYNITQDSNYTGNQPKTPVQSPSNTSAVESNDNLNIIEDDDDFDLSDLEADGITTSYDITKDSNYVGEASSNSGPSMDYRNNDQKEDDLKNNAYNAPKQNIDVVGLTMAMAKAGASEDVIRQTIQNMMKNANQEYQDNNDTNNCSII